MLIGHGGNVFEVSKRYGILLDQIIDMSSNVNPLDPPSEFFNYLIKHISCITSLPQVDSGQAVDLFCQNHSLPNNRVLCGNGTTQFIYAIPQAFVPKKVLIVGPTYSDYADACEMYNIPYSLFLTDETNAFKIDLDRLDFKLNQADMVFICNPNNPTGQIIKAEDILSLSQKHSDTCFVIDESYMPFVKDEKQYSLLSMSRKNIMILSSMSKIFKIPGLRIGFVIAAPDRIDQIKKYMLPWSLNSIGQKAIEYIMTHPSQIKQYVLETQNFIEMEKKSFFSALQSTAQLTLYNSQTSFILIRLPDHLTSNKIYDRLMQKGILIRDCSNFNGLTTHHIRVSLKTLSENQHFLTHFLSCLKMG